MNVVEVFETLQGEGALAGTPAVFVRFTGCSLWSGHAEDRERDALRHVAACPLWCDTDFRHGTKMTVDQLAERVLSFKAGKHLVVFTGGEPLLTLTLPVLRDLRAALPGTAFSIETNGTRALEGRVSLLDHVCVSPKVRLNALKQTSGDEIKVVVPAYNPPDFGPILPHFRHRFVQPQALTADVGVSSIADINVQHAIRFCLENPEWRLSFQMHKAIGLP